MIAVSKRSQNTFIQKFKIWTTIKSLRQKESKNFGWWS